MIEKVMICRFCRAEMLFEEDYCCDYCGATYNKFSDRWTLPTVEVICDKCNCKVSIQNSNLKTGLSSVEFYTKVLCDNCTIY